MSLPLITDLVTANPGRLYPQAEAAEKYVRLMTDQRRARAVHAIFNKTGVGSRYSVGDESFYSQPRSTQERNDKYMEAAVPFGEATLQKLFAQSEYTPQDIDDFMIVSCTGYSIPGLDLHLAGRLGMRNDLRRTCILGMGCYGSFPGLRRASESVSSGHNRVALVLSLELCSLHLQFDTSAETAVSAGLFADGAAAAIVSMDSPPTSEKTMPRLMNFKTQCDYQTLDEMSFTVSDTGFRMYLSSYVPDVLAANVEAFVDDLLAECHLTRDQITHWGIHPGSTKIVDYVADSLELAHDQVDAAHQVLHDYGNMSSATILFVLNHIQQTKQPQQGDYGVLMAFGPGLTIEGALVQW